MITVGELLKLLYEAEEKYGKDILYAHVYMSIHNDTKLVGCDYCCNVEIDEQHLTLTN